MPGARAAVALGAALLLLSALAASVLRLLAIEAERAESRPPRALYPPPGADPARLLWFLQISDIHISIFRDGSRIAEFQQFCEETVKRLKPHVVLATGDLTDAKARDNMGSSQVVKEWVSYRDIIDKSGVTGDTVWLDIRGNHDNFNVGSLHSKNNYFRSFSIQGPKYPKSYIYHDNFNGVNIAFLGIDACPEPGLRRPFNFVGILDTQEIQNIRKLQAEASNKANHTIWFGHYPTSCILWLDENSHEGTIRNVIRSTGSSLAYLCGHLHTMGGLVPHMYTMQKGRYLELELSDWKDNRIYRLAAIDHGFFSFVDQKHNDWPLVLVTNPKHARYMMPDREPLSLIAESTHVRILAFSDSEISEVNISIDKGQLQKCNNVKGPLFVCPWKPGAYSRGLHRIQVFVKDSQGKEKQLDHPFSLDGTSLPFDVFPRIFLMLDASNVFQGIFGTLLVTSVLPLVVLKLQKSSPHFNRKCGSQVLQRLWILTKVDRLFYPLLLYSIYLPIGPWSVGELIDGHIGAIFAWGILINGSFLPGSFTYAYGCIQLLFVHIPLIFVLASTVERRLAAQRSAGVKRLVNNMPFIFLLTIQMLLAYFFWLAYGTMAFLFGPLRTWSILLSMILWYKSMTLPPDYCRKLVKVTNVPVS